MSDFKPRLMATTLHIVPWRDPAEACRIMIERFPEAPSVPRLSFSVKMYMDGMPCLVVDREKKRLLFDLSRGDELERFYERYLDGDVDYFAMDPQSAPGFYTLVDLLKRSPPPGLKLVHLELPGPITWGLSLIDQATQKAGWYEPTIKDVLIKTLEMKARWQEKTIHQALPGVATMVTLGEPSLGMIETPFGAITAEEVIAAIDETLSGVQGLSCVHCCTNMDWPMLIDTQVMVINFDAYQYADKIALYPEAMTRLLDRGGMLAWGIVPVNPEDLADQDVDGLLARLVEGMELLVAKGVDRRKLLERSFITPCCTPSTLAPPEAQRAWRLTGEISRAMRRRFLAG
ncbi:MAG: hypothetical protein KJ621_03805 [Proteobacteria bacterium]|nr:hypothetical protein [Pseudomonadota bacterium]